MHVISELVKLSVSAYDKTFDSFTNIKYEIYEIMSRGEKNLASNEY